MSDGSRFAWPRDWRLATAAGIPVMVVALLAINPLPAGLFYDDGIYLSLGKSLAEGGGFRYPNLPGEPSAVHFPPMYPAILAGIWRITSSLAATIAAGKFLNALLLGGIAGLVAVFLYRVTNLSKIAAATLAILGSCAMPVLTLAGLLLSEPLFLALVLIGLAMAERARDPSASAGSALGAGLILGLAYLTRSAAFPALLAAAVAFAVHRQWRVLGWFCAGAAPAVLSWHWWLAMADPLPEPLIASYGAYTDWYRAGMDASIPRFVLETALHNLQALPGALGRMIVPTQSAIVHIAAALLLFGLLATGAWRLARRAPVAIVAMVGYLGLVLLWPFHPDRFLHAIWPALLIPLAAGAHPLGNPAGPQHVLRYLTPAAGGLALTGYLWTTAAGALAHSWEQPHRQIAARLVPTLQWIEAHTEPTDLVATGLDAAVYLYTGRRTIPHLSWTAVDYLHPPTPELLGKRLFEMAEQFRPRFIIVQHRMNQAQIGVDYLLRQETPAVEVVATLEDGTRVLRYLFD